MRKFTVSTPEIEVSGEAMSSFGNSALADELAAILQKYGMHEITAGEWYPQQLALDVLREMASDSRDSLALVSVGVKVIDTAVFPPVDSFEAALEMFTSVHMMNHRNLPANECIETRRVSDRHVQVINRTPYPDDLIYGYVHSIVSRFKAAGTRPTVKYAYPDRVNSDDDMVYDIMW
jgi:hypothetical protein